MLGDGELAPLGSVERVARPVAPGVHPEVEAVQMHGVEFEAGVDPPPADGLANAVLEALRVRPRTPVDGAAEVVALWRASLGVRQLIEHRDDEDPFLRIGNHTSRVYDDRAGELGITTGPRSHGARRGRRPVEERAGNLGAIAHLGNLAARHPQHVVGCGACAQAPHDQDVVGDRAYARLPQRRPGKADRVPLGYGIAQPYPDFRALRNPDERARDRHRPALLGEAQDIHAGGVRGAGVQVALLPLPTCGASHQIDLEHAVAQPPCGFPIVVGNGESLLERSGQRRCRGTLLTTN